MGHKGKGWRFGALLVLGLAVAIPSTEGFSQVVKLNYGGTSASSGQYVYCVAMTKAINDQVPEVRVTNMETSASVENARLLHRGDIDFGNITIDIAYRMANGVEDFKGMKNQTLRQLWCWSILPHTVFVTKESGITSIYQLTGKKFAAGFTGSDTEFITFKLFEANEIKPAWFRGGLAALVDAVKNRQLLGYVKSGGPDPSVQDIASLIPITLLPIPDEALAKGNALFPGRFTRANVKARSYPGQEGEIPSYPVIPCDIATTRLSEDLGYKMCKAIYQAREKLAKSIKYAEVFLDFPQSALIGSIPVHAGLYKLCKEMGVKVPEHLIPPEAKR